MTLADLIHQDPNTETLKLWIKKVPYAAFLGIKADLRDDKLLFILPREQKIDW